MARLSVTATNGDNLRNPGTSMITDPKTAANLFLIPEKSLRNNLKIICDYKILTIFVKISLNTHFFIGPVAKLTGRRNPAGPF